MVLPDNFEYTIVPILKYIYPEGNTNKSARIKIKDLEQTGSIDLSKLNSGIMNLKRWQFYTDFDNNKTSIRMGFDSYPKKNQKFRDLKLKFYELDVDNNGNTIGYENDRNSNLKRIYYISKDQEQIGFNGTFDFVVDWNESQTKISSKYSKKIKWQT